MISSAGILNEQKKSDDFDERLHRYRLSGYDLYQVLKEDRKNHPEFLFGERFSFLRGCLKDDRYKEYPYPNELVALYVLLSSATALQGFSSTKSVLHRGSIFSKGRLIQQPIAPTIRERLKKSRGSRNPRFVSHLEDFVDLHNRFIKIPRQYQELLIDYYGFGISAKVIARKLGKTTWALGGFLSQARKAFYKELNGLIPPTEHRASILILNNSSDNNQVSTDPDEQRRTKVYKFLYKKHLQKY